MALMSVVPTKWYGQESVFLETTDGIEIVICRPTAEPPDGWHSIYDTGVYFKFLYGSALCLLAREFGDYERSGSYPHQYFTFDMGSGASLTFTEEEAAREAARRVPNMLIRDYFEYLLGIAKEGE